MNVYLFAAVILLLPALCTALGAAGVFLVRRADDQRCGFLTENICLTV